MGNKKHKLFSEDYFRSHKYMKVKAEVMEYFHKVDYAVSKTHVRHVLGIHAYVIIRVIDDLVLGNFIEEVRTSGVVYYRKSEKNE